MADTQHTPEPWNCGGLDYCPECGATGDYDELKARHDELLAALIEISTAPGRSMHVERIAKRAIAKAEGQQS